MKIGLISCEIQIVSDKVIHCSVNESLSTSERQLPVTVSARSPRALSAGRTAARSPQPGRRVDGGWTEQAVLAAVASAVQVLVSGLPGVTGELPRSVTGTAAAGGVTVLWLGWESVSSGKAVKPRASESVSLAVIPFLALVRYVWGFPHSFRSAGLLLPAEELPWL